MYPRVNNLSKKLYGYSTKFGIYSSIQALHSNNKKVRFLAHAAPLRKISHMCFLWQFGQKAVLLLASQLNWVLEASFTGSLASRS